MGWAMFSRHIGFDVHADMPREGTTAMTSRKDVYETLVFRFRESGKFLKYSLKKTQSERPRG